MRKLCPNLHREDGLETVLEVPIPEEMFSDSSANTKNYNKSWQNMKSWVMPNVDRSPASVLGGNRSAEIQLLLGVVGAPLIPFPVSYNNSINKNIKDHTIEVSMAKYIVQQYIAATGGDKALDSMDSMYAMGKVKMGVSEFIQGDGLTLGCNNLTNMKVMKIKSVRNGAGEVGGFVLWQKRPELWCLELVVSSCKISAGSDGKVAWRQTPWHNSHASRGPPRPLRRSLQGLDPRSTANLFSNAICIGEKVTNNEDCFVLKFEARSSTLKSRSSINVEIIRHTIWVILAKERASWCNLKTLISSTFELMETTMFSGKQRWKLRYRITELLMELKLLTRAEQWFHYLDMVMRDSKGIPGRGWKRCGKLKKLILTLRGCPWIVFYLLGI